MMVISNSPSAVICASSDPNGGKKALLWEGGGGMSILFNCSSNLPERVTLLWYLTSEYIYMKCIPHNANIWEQRSQK